MTKVFTLRTRATAAATLRRWALQLAARKISPERRAVLVGELARRLAAVWARP
jgi:hypothetical protein